MLEQRNRIRFDLHLPYEIHETGGRSRITGLTRNVSADGVLLMTAAAVRIGERIEFSVTLPTGSGSACVKIHCTGRVVRVEGDECATTIETYGLVREVAASAAA